MHYIFCPRCAGSEWLTNRAKQAEGGMLNAYQCNHCHNFTFTEHCKRPALQEAPLEVRPYQIDINIGHYRISMFLFRQTTHFMDRLNNDKVILIIPEIPDWEWYAAEDALLQKIQLYLTFS